MSVKSLFISTLSFTLGIGAATQAKSQLLEQRLPEITETEELEHRSALISQTELSRMNLVPFHFL